MACWQVKTIVCLFQSYPLWVALWENLLNLTYTEVTQQGSLYHPSISLLSFSDIGKRRVVTSASSGWGWPQGSSCWEDLSQQLRTPCRRRIWQLLQEATSESTTVSKRISVSNFSCFQHASKPLVAMVLIYWYWFWYRFDHVFGSAKKHVLKISCFELLQDVYRKQWPLHMDLFVTWPVFLMFFLCG